MSSDASSSGNKCTYTSSVVRTLARPMRPLSLMDLNEVWNELTDVLKVYNEHRSALANLLSYRTFNVADAVPQNVKAERFEEATEFGTPRGISDPNYLKAGHVAERL